MSEAPAAAERHFPRLSLLLLITSSSVRHFPICRLLLSVTPPLVRHLLLSVAPRASLPLVEADHLEDPVAHGGVGAPRGPLDAVGPRPIAGVERDRRLGRLVEEGFDGGYRGPEGVAVAPAFAVGFEVDLLRRARQEDWTRHEAHGVDRRRTLHEAGEVDRRQPVAMLLVGDVEGQVARVAVLEERAGQRVVDRSVGLGLRDVVAADVLRRRGRRKSRRKHDGQQTPPNHRRR